MPDENPPQVPIEPSTPREAGTASGGEPEAVPSESETQTAQIPVNEPFETAETEPTPAQEPPQAANAPALTLPMHSGRDLLVKARATIQDRKRKKIEKILEILNAKQKITNDEVEKLLRVSDATATRYLSQLEKEGKIKQIGKTGKAVTYTKP